MKSERIEKLLWSVALPGLGQFLNRAYFKGVVILLLEFVINLKGQLNRTIMLSFEGEIVQAAHAAHFEWLLFYPCMYMYAIWDAYRGAGGGGTPYSFLPYILGAFSGTVGLFLSLKVRLFGVLLGPVWLPIIFAAAGVGIGTALWAIGNRQGSR
jgi:hypothetical protein